MNKRKYVVVVDNIREAIIQGRVKKHGDSQIVVFVKSSDDSSWDPLNAINLVIGFKAKSLYDINYIGEAISFGEGEATDENVDICVQYLIDVKAGRLLEGVPIHARSIKTVLAK